MTRQPKQEPKLLHIRPVDGVQIPGFPAREMDVTEDEWLRISAYTPPAFTLDPLPTEEEADPEKEGND